MEKASVRSQTERALVERTGRTRRGGLDSPSCPHLFLCLHEILPWSWGTVGLRSSRIHRVGGVWVMFHCSLWRHWPRKVCFFCSPSPIFPPCNSWRWCGLLTIFRLPLVSNTGLVIWVRELGRAGWLLLSSHRALFSLTVGFYKLRSCESGVQLILGHCPRPGSIAETFPYRLVGWFLWNCGVLVSLATFPVLYLAYWEMC